VALVAIARWFGGHRTWFRWSIDCWWMFLLWVVCCCAWKSTVRGTYSHKKMKVHAAHFFQQLTKWCRCKLCKWVSVFNL
jgi:hypothetical protein